MPHPSGGRGNGFQTTHTFEDAYRFVGTGRRFHSTTGEQMTANQGMAGDGLTRTIVFSGERVRHGNVCIECWGFRNSCNGTWIGECVEALDQIVH